MKFIICPRTASASSKEKYIFTSPRSSLKTSHTMPFKEEFTARLSQDDIHAVFIRPDPPVDEQYLMNTWLLDHLPKHIAVINNPSGIRTVNEKVWVSQFKNITPPTIISANKEDLLDFIAKYKNIIAKPTDAFGGKVYSILKKEIPTPRSSWKP